MAHDNMYSGARLGVSGIPESNMSNARGHAIQTAASANPVAAALDSLDRTLSGLHDRISQLEQRLAVVLSPAQPAKESDPRPPPNNSLAQQIGSAAGSASIACKRLDEIINRLEL